MKRIPLANPKRSRSPRGRESWYPYYAGFSEDFANSLLRSSNLPKKATILDPWNGSGTTTAAAAMSGYGAVGFDINPVSITLAKGRLFAGGDVKSVEPLTIAILNSSVSSVLPNSKDDPLATWFSQDSASAFRILEQSIRSLLVGPPSENLSVVGVEHMSNLAAFFYVALFRTVRQHLIGRRLSNPTWIKRNGSTTPISVPIENIHSSFLDQTRWMIASLGSEDLHSHVSPPGDIRLASSQNLPLDGRSVDLVLSSPPYCTRIDYGVATLPELATLGVNVGSGLRDLRDKLIGTPTITGPSTDWRDSWGRTCLALLQKIKDHRSRSSESYYLKTHVQYFDAIDTSMGEISRCLRKGGNCFLVVQDSFYKELYNDLPKIFQEIAVNNGLTFRKRRDFEVKRTLAGIHSHSKTYRTSSKATESVLCFTK